MLIFYVRKLFIVYISINYIVKFFLIEKNMYILLKYYIIIYLIYVLEVGKILVIVLDVCLGLWISILRNKIFFYVYIWGKIVR